MVNSALTLKFPLSPTFTDLGKLLGNLTAEEAAERLLKHGMRMAVAVGTKNERSVNWVPGNHLGSDNTGPLQEHTDVMVIGKMPGPDEERRGVNMVGPSGVLLKESLTRAGINWKAHWYATNSIRYFVPGKGKIPKIYVKECRWFLAQEICALRPKFLLLTGADAVRAVFKDKTFDEVRGCPYFMNGPEELGNVSTALADLDPKRLQVKLEYAGCLVFPTLLPSQVMHDNALMEGFMRDLEIFKSLIDNEYREHGRGDYVYIRTLPEMEALLASLADAQVQELSLDGEWGFAGVAATRRPVLRSVQIGWAEGKAAVFVFHDAGGAPAQPGPEMTRMLEVLRTFLRVRDIKLIGHNLRADALMLEEYSIPVVGRTAFDTMLADHMLNENAEHGLEFCTLRYTPMGRYDLNLNRWKAREGIGKSEMKRSAYLNVPNDILYPYAACDADATLRIAHVLRARLDSNPRLWSCYYNVVLPTSQAIYEIERTGILVDRERMEELVNLYDAKKRELLQGIRDKLLSSTFNPGSFKQVAQLLFGPKAANGLALRPVKTTGKPSRMWDELDQESRDQASPSTDQETLEYLAHEHPIVSDLRDYKLIDQVQKSFLRLPSETDGQSGEEIYTDGLLGCIDPDGRIRTHLNQMSETGRHRSSNPNLQNLPKKQDKETSRIMGLLPKIRSCFIATPGHVLIEADYKSAEVYTLAYLSNCQRLIKDAQGDLHARGAVSRFGAPKWDGYDQYKPPPEAWLEEFKALRVCSKTITFGIPYQRGAAAIAREITKSTKGKVLCTRDLAQMHIDNFYKDYPEVQAFVELCKQSVIEPGFLFNPFGRYRRATITTDTELIASQQREFVNFPIQSTVADALNTALINFYHYRDQFPGRAQYRILLAIHDAVLLECKPEYVGVVVDEVIPVCMTAGCQVPSWQPTPTYVPTKVFTLDTDMEVTLRWQDKASVDKLRSAGLEERLAMRFGKKEKAE